MYGVTSLEKLREARRSNIAFSIELDIFSIVCGSGSDKLGVAGSLII